jgi:hypothetical protein
MVIFQEAAERWDYCSLLSPIVALAVNVSVQLAMVRARRGSQFFRSIIQGFLGGGVALVIIEALLLAWRGVSGEALAFSLLVTVPTYAAMAYCYMGLATMGQTSIRIRLYSELLAARGGMRVQDFERIHDEETFLATRLRRLTESGDLVEKEGRLFLRRRRLLYIANILVAGKLILLGRKSEFE